MAEDIFTSFSRFGDRLLKELERGDRSAKKFKRLVGVIDETIVSTHQIVIARLALLNAATTVDQAKEILELLRLENLTEAFRTEGLCDLLEGLAVGLSLRTGDARQEGTFSKRDLDKVEALSHRMYNREEEVARMYSEVLQKLTDQAEDLDDRSLPSLKHTAQDIEGLLTAHVSDFTAKARLFTQVSV